MIGSLLYVRKLIEVQVERKAFSSGFYFHVTFIIAGSTFIMITSRINLSLLLSCHNLPVTSKHLDII